MNDGSPTVHHPAGWPRPSGYANAVSAEGRTVFVAGQVGWNATTGEIVSADFAAQTRRALENVVAALGAAGATTAHLTRLTWYVTDREAYMTSRQAIGEHYRAVIGQHYPAMSVVVVTALLEPRARVEIEATAVIPIPPKEDRT